MFEREYRDLAFVPRWSIIRTIKTQSVAEHSFFVAIYAEQVARSIGWTGDYGALLHCALLHDLEESFTGDMPGPAKRHAIQDKTKYHAWLADQLQIRFKLYYRALDAKEQRDIEALIKIADGLDEIFFLASEQQLGNHAVTAVAQDRTAYYGELTYHLMIDVLAKTSDEIKKFWDMVEDRIITNGVDQSVILK